MINPGVKREEGYSIYDSGQQKDVWVKNNNGEPYIGKVWPGECVFPDFTQSKTREWWAPLYKDFMAQGIDGVWNDMNEPSVFNGPDGSMPEDNIHLGNDTIPKDSHLRYHNVYVMLMVNASRQGIEQANPDKRPFLLTRSNFLGGLRYAATWTGDNAATWTYLKMIIKRTTILLCACVLSLIQVQSQNLTIISDKDCMLLIDGKEEYELNANQAIEKTVSGGKHTLVAVTTDRKLHYRNEIDIRDEGNYDVQISFLPKINYQKKMDVKEEKRKAKIIAYSKQRSGIIEDIGNNMVKIKENSFRMGNSDGEDNEKPVREVFLDDYLISPYEVTQKQWMAVMGNNPSHFADCDNCPVENVHWYDAILFCNKLSRLSGLSPYYTIDSAKADTNNHNFYDHIKWIVTRNEEANGYRLPTEAEWEYAAANMSDFVYAGSDSINEVGWTLFNAKGSTHPVGQKKPNAFGLYDMSGNVWEWCYDWYSGDYYKNGGNHNPKGLASGRHRVIRSGAWKAHQMHARVSNREKEGADNANSFTGFRIVRNK